MTYYRKPKFCTDPATEADEPFVDAYLQQPDGSYALHPELEAMAEQLIALDRDHEERMAEAHRQTEQIKRQLRVAVVDQTLWAALREHDLVPDFAEAVPLMLKDKLTIEVDLGPDDRSEEPVVSVSTPYGAISVAEAVRQWAASPAARRYVRQRPVEPGRFASEIARIADWSR